ncbi:MAG: META domain-containing protein [Tannerella sp.]|jgi:heat shock protein HslJ|nr:META domain-containing protein [Tannerella sp.]
MKKQVIILSLTAFLLGMVSCRTSQTQLAGVYWKLTELSGKPIPPRSEGAAEPHLTFQSGENRVFGHGGCNTFRGTYELKSDGGIRFSPMAATLKMCFNAETENEYMRVFEATEYYELKGSTLVLYKEKGNPLAQFEAIRK